ncbi:MAG: hypothetical protein ACTSYS_01750 [Promethearchaeota archaeon]
MTSPDIARGWTMVIPINAMPAKKNGIKMIVCIRIPRILNGFLK